MAGYKLKTHRGTAKRVKVTGSGKYLKRKGALRHLLTSKSRNRKRTLKGPSTLDATSVRMMSRLLPNG